MKEKEPRPKTRQPAFTLEPPVSESRIKDTVALAWRFTNQARRERGLPPALRLVGGET